MVLFIERDLEYFEIGSNKLISDYDFVPKGISDNQKKICNCCRYRWRMIDSEIARINKRRAVSFDGFEPNCYLKRCLIDGQCPGKVIKLKKLDFVKGV